MERVPVYTRCLNKYCPDQCQFFSPSDPPLSLSVISSTIGGAGTFNYRKKCRNCGCTQIDKEKVLQIDNITTTSSINATVNHHTPTYKFVVTIHMPIMMRSIRIVHLTLDRLTRTLFDTLRIHSMNRFS